MVDEIDRGQMCYILKPRTIGIKKLLVNLKHSVNVSS